MQGIKGHSIQKSIGYLGSPAPEFNIRIPAQFWKEADDEEFEADALSGGSYTHDFEIIDKIDINKSAESKYIASKVSAFLEKLNEWFDKNLLKESRTKKRTTCNKKAPRKS